MTGFTAMVTELFFRIKLYFRGVRFKQRPAGDELLVRSILVRIEDKYDILFNCYRKLCIEHVLRRGQLSIHEYCSYFIKAEFSATAPEVLLNTTDNTLYFSGLRNPLNDDEEVTLSVLVDVFLDILAFRLKDDQIAFKAEKEVGNETFSI